MEGVGATLEYLKITEPWLWLRSTETKRSTVYFNLLHIISCLERLHILLKWFPGCEKHSPIFESEIPDFCATWGNNTGLSFLFCFWQYGKHRILYYLYISSLLLLTWRRGWCDWWWQHSPLLPHPGMVPWRWWGLGWRQHAGTWFISIVRFLIA